MVRRRARLARRDPARPQPRDGLREHFRRRHVLSTWDAPHVTRRPRWRLSRVPESWRSAMTAAVYVQTNDAADNEIVAFMRSDEGALTPLGRHSTGGRGTGAPHLPSQNSIVLSDDGRWLLVVNAGSDELSLFAVKPDGLELTDRAASGGSRPTSVAVSGPLAYVLNNATPNLAGFRIGDGRLVGIEGSARPLSAEDADPAQVAFSRD